MRELRRRWVWSLGGRGKRPCSVEGAKHSCGEARFHDCSLTLSEGRIKQRETKISILSTICLAEKQKAEDENGVVLVGWWVMVSLSDCAILVGVSSLELKIKGLSGLAEECGFS